MPLQVKTGTSKNLLIYDMTALNAFVDTNKLNLKAGRRCSHMLLSPHMALNSISKNTTII
jgi:hypothetical protein